MSDSLFRMDWKRLRLLPLIFLGFFATVAIDFGIRGKEAKENQVRMSRRFQLISNPPEAHLVTSNEGFKTTLGFSTRVLETELPEKNIKAYYERELEGPNWVFMKEDPTWQGTRLVFCNDEEDTLAIELPGEAGRKYRYTITMSWNKSRECR